MEVQTLSVVVPAGCPNNCKFCVSRLHDSGDYINQIEKNRRFKHLYRNDYTKRLSFARDNGCNTIIYTGDGEPVYNMGFLENVATWNREIENSFRWLELQTSGVSVDDEKLRWLRNEIEVATISLSLSSIFSNEDNARYNATPAKLTVNIDEVCAEIKRYDFNLRLSLNMTDLYNEHTPEQIFERARQLEANQVTFRVLYTAPDPENEEEAAINSWIQQHGCREETLEQIRQYILAKGRVLERLAISASRFNTLGCSISSFSAVVMCLISISPMFSLFSR